MKYTTQQFTTLDAAKMNLAALNHDQLVVIEKIAENCENESFYKKQKYVMRLYHFASKINSYFTLNQAWMYVNDQFTKKELKEKYFKKTYPTHFVNKINYNLIKDRGYSQGRYCGD